MCSNPCESEVTCFRPESNRGPYGLLTFLSAALSTTELWWRMNHRQSFRTLSLKNVYIFWNRRSLSRTKNYGRAFRLFLFWRFWRDCKPLPYLWMRFRVRKGVRSWNPGIFFVFCRWKFSSPFLERFVKRKNEGLIQSVHNWDPDLFTIIMV